MCKMCAAARHRDIELCNYKTVIDNVEVFTSPGKASALTIKTPEVINKSWFLNFAVGREFR